VVASEDPAKMAPMEGGEEEDRPNIFPVKKFKIPVDVEAAKKELQLNPGDSIVSELKLDINRNSLDKNDLAVLAVIAANKWKRPIYFTSTQELENLGLEKYTRMEGLSYRLVPIENPNNVGVRKMYDVVMNKFAYGNANRPGVYFDEENRRHVNSIRQAHALLGLTLAQLNMKDSAKKVLNRYDSNVLEENVPYGMTSNRGNFHNRVSMSFLLAAYEAGDLTLAAKVNGSMKRDLEQQMRYYRTLGDDMQADQLAMQAAGYLQNKGSLLTPAQEGFAQDILSSYQMIMQLGEWEKQYAGGKKPGVPNENAGGQIITAPDSGAKVKDTP